MGFTYYTNNFRKCVNEFTTFGFQEEEPLFEGSPSLLCLFADEINLLKCSSVDEFHMLEVVEDSSVPLYDHKVIPYYVTGNRKVEILQVQEGVVLEQNEQSITINLSNGFVMKCSELYECEYEHKCHDVYLFLRIYENLGFTKLSNWDEKTGGDLFLGDLIIRLSHSSDIFDSREASIQASLSIGNKKLYKKMKRAGYEVWIEEYGDGDSNQFYLKFPDGFVILID